MGLIGNIFLGFVLGCSAASAEIEKFASPTDDGIALSWWPGLPAVDGWHHERESSSQNGANVLVPHGFTFADAETVMYARAIYKPRSPETTSLEMLIENDKEAFRSHSPGIVIEEAVALMTADRKRLRSFTFFPRDQGNWERVAYGEEGDFYLIFTVSSRSLKGYKGAMKAYEQLVGRYKEKP